jgi:hypothetical protein
LYKYRPVRVIFEIACTLGAAKNAVRSVRRAGARAAENMAKGGIRAREEEVRKREWVSVYMQVSKNYKNV